MDKQPVETATLGGGCFWCLEAVYELMEGVESVRSGYSGGAPPNPTYEQVCSGATGHAEVTQLRFDPSITPYEEILHVFFSIHDPTTPNRQGNDVGTQYRSVIFYDSAEQKNTAEMVIEELNRSGVFSAPVVTELVPLEAFYPAEDYHQEYYRRNPNQAYCRYVVDPKVAKFRAKYFDKLKNKEKK
jgi:peptide-methionine (S)-S-oxide reductase